ELHAARGEQDFFQVALLPLELPPPGSTGGPSVAPPGGGPVSAPVPASREAAPPPTPAQSEARLPAAAGELVPVSYRALPWLAPAYWLPLYTSDAVGLGVGVSTRGGDLLQRHLYAAAMVYDLLDPGLKTELRYSWHGYPLSLFCNLYLEHHHLDGPADPALYPGLSLPLIERRLRLEAELGLKYEPPYLGPGITVSLSTVDQASRALAPERGTRLVLDAYLNTAGREFAVLTGEYTGYASLRPLLLSMELRGRTAPGGEGLVLSGKTGGPVYVPLEGLYTPGYPEPVAGDTAADLVLKAGVALLRLERGMGGLPLFFRGAVFSLFTAHGVLIAGDPDQPFVAEGWKQLLDDPGRYVRSSWGPELQVSAVAGYRVPVELRVGYVFPLSAGGRPGMYVTLDAGLSF
ncbi:MAG: hypothetical protein ACOC8N_04985, partial [Spirochaetota bacterium]